jgi:carbon-monoxide dehydrogenase small subunit
MFELSITVNGKPVIRRIEPRTLLVEFLREELRLTGTHVGCDTTQCGCCSVHLNGRAVKSCTVLAAQAHEGEVLTVEGLAGEDGELHPMQRAFSEHHALQCGYCTPGMIMSGIAIAERHQEPTPEIVRRELEGNLCRCTGYVNIVSAVIAGAGAMQRTETEGSS